MKNRRMLVFLVLSAAIFFMGNAHAFFGFDTAPLIALLSQQLVVANSSLSAANQALSELHNMQKGVTNIRKLAMSDGEFYGLMSVNHELFQLETSVEGIENRLEEFTPLKSLELGDDIRDLRHSVFNRELSTSAFYTAEQFKQETVEDEANTGMDLIDAAQEVQSGDEAAALQAEGTGVLVYQNSEMMALQAHHLEVSAAALELDNTRGKEKAVGQMLEAQQLKASLNRMPAVR